MKKLFIISLAIISMNILASEKCYTLSPDGYQFSRTPEMLCVDQDDNYQAVITLKTGMPWDLQEIAVFNMTLLSAARSPDFNKNVYGIAYPRNSIFNDLKIAFDGKIGSNKDKGVVFIGKNKFHYVMEL